MRNGSLSVTVKSDDYLVGVHVLEEVEDGGVGEADEANDDVERGEAEHLDDVAGDDGTDGVGRGVRDVRDGVHRPVHSNLHMNVDARICVHAYIPIHAVHVHGLMLIFTPSL